MANDITNELAERIDELARITQEEFSSVRSEMGQGFSEVNKELSELKSGIRQILEIVTDSPSQVSFTKLSHKVQDHEDRLGVVEHKLQIV